MERLQPGSAFVGAVILALTAIASSPVSAEEDARPGAGRLDCGPQALWTLLRIEGRPADHDRIAASLPPPAATGSSMRELQVAARACGLRLDGVRLRLDGRAPDRPALIRVDRGPHGHFAVIRPVGHTGTLVQVLDPSAPPFVMDAADLEAGPAWTGLALVPRRPHWPARFAGAMAMASGLILLAPRRPPVRLD